MVLNIFYFGSNLHKEKVSNHNPEHYPPNEKMQDLDLSQSEKLSEIKQPLPSLCIISKNNVVFYILTTFARPRTHKKNILHPFTVMDI